MGVPSAKTILIAMVGCALIRAQNTDLDQRVIEAGKNADVRTLDAQLPKARFDEWFRRQFGTSVSVKWEATDCGEQDGTHTREDIPLCAEASAKLSGDRLLVVQIVVATLKKGVQGKPGLWSLALLTKDGQYHSAKRLSELSRLLARTP